MSVRMRIPCRLLWISLAACATIFSSLPAVSESIGLEINMSPIQSFDALEGDSPCKVLFFKSSAQICGRMITQSDLTSWTMLPDNREGCSAIGICYWRSISFSIGYTEGVARRAVLLKFVNQKTSEKFFAAMSNWEAGNLAK